jgi:hypothetical protein
MCCDAEPQDRGARRQARARTTLLAALQVLKQSDCADTLSFLAECSHRLARSSQNIMLFRSSDFRAFERQSSACLRNSLAFELGMAGSHYVLMYKCVLTDSQSEPQPVE